MSEIFGFSIMGNVEELSSVDTEDFDDALESVMDEYDEYRDNTIGDILGVALEGCGNCSDDCECDEVDLSDDGEDVAEDDDDFYNTDDDLGMDEIDAEEDAEEVDLSETSEFDDDDDAFESVNVDVAEDKIAGTVNQMAVTTVFAEDNAPRNTGIYDMILDDDIEMVEDEDEDDDVTSDDSEDLTLDDEDDEIAEESVQTFDDISRSFSSVLDSLED